MLSCRSRDFLLFASGKWEGWFLVPGSSFPANECAQGEGAAGAVDHHRAAGRRSSLGARRGERQPRLSDPR